MCCECALQRVTKWDMRMLSVPSHHTGQGVPSIPIFTQRNTCLHTLRNTYKGADRTMSCSRLACLSPPRKRNSRHRYGHCTRPLKPSSADAAVRTTAPGASVRNTLLHCCCCCCCGCSGVSLCLCLCLCLCLSPSHAPVPHERLIGAVAHILRLQGHASHQLWE